MGQNKEPLQKQANGREEAMAFEGNARSQPWRDVGVRFWHQLRWNLILSYILLAILPLTIGVAITLNRVRTRAQEQATNELVTVTELKRDQIESWLADSSSLLDLFIANPTLRDNISFVTATVLDPELADDSLNSLLSEAVNAQSLFEEFFVYNIDGRIVAGSNPGEIGKVTENKPYFSSSLSGNFMQLPYYELSAEGGKLTMVMTRPLIDEQQTQIVGVLAGRLDLSTLGQIMTERAGLHESDETYLVSFENNYFLTPSRAEGYPLTRAYHSEGIDQVLLGMDGSGVYDNYFNSPVTVIGVYRWIPELQAGLVAEIAEAEALTTFLQVRNTSIILAALAALAAIAAGFYTATRISSPIIRLTQVATQIAGGDLNQRTEIKQTNEIGLLAAVFNHMTTQLQEFIGALEERVAARTQRLEIAASLSERLSAILDLEQLLSEVVNQIKESFDYYHAHIYLLDGRRENLVMAEGTGEAGAEMKRQGHSIPLNARASLVARAARNAEVVSVENVREAADWLANPLLPHTYSEMAVPIILDEQVVGVLDVQEDEIAGLDEGDASLLRSLANQVAVAIRNARLFEEIQQTNQELSHALEELRTTQGQLVEAEKMAALGGLVAGVAHEINTPVGVGVTAASTLQDKTISFSETYKNGQMKRSDLEKYLSLAEQSSGMILRNLERAAKLIQSFKQVAVDQSSEERRQFPIRAYLEEILLSLRPKLKKTQHTIEINGDDRLNVDSYPGAFSQIVTNLVMNSLLHAYGLNEWGRLSFNFWQTGSRLIFEYNDDGRGIPAENLSKIFEPFFTTKRTQGGSGLGLHIIYNLVTQRLGGIISCKSELGNGAKFIIEVPVL